MLASATVGESWTRVRGDDSPGVTYAAFLETSSGRLIAAGDSGQLMISDDGGTNWRYEAILIDGEPLAGFVSDLINDGPNVVGVATRLIEQENRFGLPFTGQTVLLSSSNDGDSWSSQVFPISEALFLGDPFPGVALTGLHRGPGGSLVAFGTTQVSSGAITWSIGGAVFRRTGSWEQAFFEFGALRDMSNTGSRVTAVGFQTAIDSPDGNAWNGYLMTDANVLLGGTPLDSETLRGLDLTDIAFQNNQYVANAQTYIPLPGNPRISTGIVDRSFTLVSGNPFDGGRMWTGTEQNRAFPFFLSAGSNLLSLLGGAFQYGAGASWNSVDPDVALVTRSYGPVGSSSAVAIRSSEQAWRSDNAGQSWTQVLHLDLKPNLQLETVIGDTLLAREGGRLWASSDNGVTWVQRADPRAQIGRSAGFLTISDNVIYTANSGSAGALSRDQGFTWEALDLPGPSSAVLLEIVLGENGRLIVAPEGRNVFSNIDQIFTSDDNGQSWQPHDAEIPFGQNPGRGIAAGGGRIVILINQTSVFMPELLISDDNGDTWRRTSPFQTIDGLDMVTNAPGERAIRLSQIERSPSGRLLIRGDDEILTSDDRGDTWEVRVNLNLRNSMGLESNLGWEIRDLVRAGDRWAALGFRANRTFGPETEVQFVLLSDDDGTTWREVVFSTGSDILTHLAVGANGRLIAAGSRGSVYISDFDQPAPGPAAARVREGETLELLVPRPPVPGAIEARFTMSPDTASADADFLVASGTLSWDSDDMAPQMILIETVNNETIELAEQFSVDVSVNNGVVVSTQFVISIDDDDGGFQPGIELIDGVSLVTTEEGGSDTFRLALQTQPASDVTVAFENLDPDEVALSVASVTFTTENWKVAQDVTVTGLADGEEDQDASATIRVSTITNDENYEEVGLRTIGILNLGVSDTLFANGFE